MSRLVVGGARAPRYLKLTAYRSLLLTTQPDGSVIERRVDTAETFPASVDLHADGSLEIFVDPYRLVATRTGMTGWWAGDETGPYGDNRLHVFPVRSRHIRADTIRSTPWVLLLGDGYARYVTFDSPTSDRATAIDVFSGTPSGTVTLDFVHVADGVARVELTLAQSPSDRTSFYLKGESDTPYLRPAAGTRWARLCPVES